LPPTLNDYINVRREELWPERAGSPFFFDPLSLSLSQLPHCGLKTRKGGKFDDGKLTNTYHNRLREAFFKRVFEPTGKIHALLM
jgi:hypothetical protein